MENTVAEKNNVLVAELDGIKISVEVTSGGEKISFHYFNDQGLEIWTIEPVESLINLLEKERLKSNNIIETRI